MGVRGVKSWLALSRRGQAIGRPYTRQSPAGGRGFGSMMNKNLEPIRGLEPRTYALRMRCSTS